jgi:hypothetical protein
MSLTWLFTISLALAALNLYGVLIVYWKSWEISAWIASVSLFSFIAPKLLKTGTGNGGTGKKMFIKIALAIGLLLLVPILILYLVGGIIAYISSENSQILGLIVAALVLACINWRFINLNEISLHNYYRDCLSRAYMMFYDSKHGDISHGDKLKFSELDPGKSPYHIINTTLNLKKEMPVNKGKGVFRTGESFVFTKNWCGSDNTGYIHTEQYERYDRHVNVGTAMAISGAAANIGMAQKNIFVLRLLMGLFNIRLGYWALNPGNTKRLILRGYPGSLEVLRESLGNYKLDSHYINLSDGGHFDNIGVYELLRRRCKYIIVGDAEADPEMKFEAISYIMRLARIDFGIEIRIDPSDIKPDRETGFSRSHCVVGRIDYPEGDFGYLLYCKASLSGDEPEHLYEYRVKHPQFPHQTTADQWFDEQQFEAYRELGYHVGREAFAPVAGTEISDNEELFNALKESWHPHSEAIENQFTKHTVELNRIVSDLKNDKDLKFMDAQMYPEWDQLIPPLTEPQHSESERPHSYLWLPKRNKEIRKGFYLCNLMMQLMENVYTDLNLESEHAHPDNRGWMNLFRHWSWSGMFRVSWAISACTFGARFQKFCEKHLELDLGKISVRKRDDVDVAVDDELNPYEQKVVLNFKQDGKYFFVSLYVLELKVRNPLDSKNDKTFHFGFALVNAEKELVYFRVQDHLRQMGLGKTALKKLKTHPDDDIKIAKFSGELLKFLLAEKESLAEAEEDTDAIPIDVQDLVSFERMCKQVGLS